MLLNINVGLHLMYYTVINNYEFSNDSVKIIIIKIYINLI